MNSHGCDQFQIEILIQFGSGRSHVNSSVRKQRPSNAYSREHCPERQTGNRYQKKARQRDQVRQVELQRAHHDGPDAILAMSRRKRVQPEEVLRTITSVIVGSGAVSGS